MPPTIYVNRELQDQNRRASIYKGDFHLFTENQASKAIVAWVRELVTSTFENMDPETAQFDLSVPDFAARVGPLKSRFTNAQKTKELCRELIISMGCDPDDTYFDLPRLRVAPSSNYLKAGVSYAYKAHRDSWYAQPPLVINYWTPVFDVTGDNVMSFYPGYWAKNVPNSGFDYDEWNSVHRGAAVKQLEEENRPHPLPTIAIDPVSEIRIALNAGDVTMFSTCHLHATADNVSGKTRFSYDLRTISLSDLRNNEGPEDMDKQARGSTLGDFLRVSDLKPLAVPSLTALAR